VALTPAAQDVTVLSLAATADYVSTVHALKSCSGCVELSPFVREPAVHIVAKAAIVAGTTAACEHLRKKKKHRLAKLLRWTVVGVWLGLAVNNVNSSRRDGR
jgi:hypothetical protein